jgi:aryl-alcohol dehydrogenase-like predicted oxidoreductase
MNISRIGLGTWAHGGSGWAFSLGRQDDRDSAQTIRRAVEIGINWIDTAPAYGLGHAEEVVGSVLSSIPETERPFVFTKAGRLWDPADPLGPLRTDLSPAVLRRELDGSLRRLGVERIDLYQVHWPPLDGTPVEDYWCAFVDLREQGKIRAFGLCNHNVPTLQKAEALAHVDSLQPPFSLIRREVAEAEIPWCADHGTGVIAYSPMQSGLLAGAMRREHIAALPDGDWRAHNPEFLGDKLAANLGLVERLGPVGRSHGVSTAAIAMAWVLAWPGVTGAIAGARYPFEIEDCEVAANLLLANEDLDEIAAALRATGAGGGPARPPEKTTISPYPAAIAEPSN